MKLQENIQRIKEIMGLGTEENLSAAPWGIIFDGEDKILVGDMHQIPVELSKELEDKVVNVANQYGYYGEGIGLEHNEAITKSSFYERLDPKKHYGSWDRKLIESGEVPEDKKYVFLYSLFSNPKENHRLEKLLENTEEEDTIFDVLLKTIPDWSADMGEFSLGQKELNKFLKEISENGIDFIQMSQQKADEKSLSEFLDLFNEPQGEIILKIDGNKINQQDIEYIFQLPYIINDVNENGTYQIGNLEIIIQNERNSYI